MTNRHLIDLEELILSCRDEKARSLIQEAHDCYRAGAYRASIISTWIAIVYDLIEKLRELSSGGSVTATQLVEKLDEAHTSGEHSKLQSMENKLLDICKTEFDFFHPLELEHLKRIFTDRNRAAHANHSKHNELFQVSAELARLHFRNAIEIVLSQPATVGKAALAELFSLINTPYFPKDKERAKLVLKHSPLEKPKRNLFNEFVCGLMAKATSGDLDADEVKLRITIISAASELHPDLFHELVQSNLKNVIRKTPDKGLRWLMVFLAEIGQIQKAVDDGVQVKIDEFIKSGKSIDVGGAALVCLKSGLFTQRIEERIQKETRHTLKFFTSEESGWTPNVVVDTALSFLTTAPDYSTASDICRDYLLPAALTLTRGQIENSFKIADENAQVSPAWSFKALVRQLKNNPLLAGGEFEAVLQQHQWGAEYYQDAPQVIE